MFRIQHFVIPRHKKSIYPTHKNQCWYMIAGDTDLEARETYRRSNVWAEVVANTKE